MKTLILYIISFLFLSWNICLGQVKLILPHSAYQAPTHCIIGEEEVVTFQLDYASSYCKFDLATGELITSGASKEYPSVVEKNVFNKTYPEIYDDEASMFSSAPEEVSYMNISWKDRDNEIKIFKKEGKITSDDSEQKLDSKIVHFCDENFDNIRYLSVSPDQQYIGISVGLLVYVFKCADGAKIWESEKIKSFKKAPEFRLLDDDIIVLPEHPETKQAFQATWFDYSENKVNTSSASITNSMFVGEYQALHYFTFATGDPAYGDIETTQYINLKNGEFSEPKKSTYRERYLIGYHVLNEVLPNEISKEAFERFDENYTQYTSMWNYFDLYYSFLGNLREYDQWLYEEYERQGIEDDEIVKTKLTPMTLPPRFFTENDFKLSYSEDNYYESEDVDLYRKTEMIYVYYGKATLKTYRDLLFADDNFTKGKEIVFWNSEKPPHEAKVKLVVTSNGTPIFLTHDNYFFSTKDVKDFLAFSVDGKRFSFEQFDLVYNRPDIILDRLGYADQALIDAYRAAYLKRIEKMGFTEEMLKPTFNIPTCEVLNLAEIPKTVSDKELALNISGHDAQENLKYLRIWNNNVPVFGRDGIRLKNEKSFSKEINIPLQKGKNNIELAVMNAVGAESYKVKFSVNCSEGKEKPDLYFVSIGTSKYEDSKYDLNYAAKDAKDVYDLFSRENSIYGSTKGLLLRDEDVKKDVTNEIAEFLSDAEIDDQVILFIAGHGVLDQDLNYVLATHDMDFRNPAEKGIPYERIEEILDNLKPLKKVLLLDACHGGEIDKDDVSLTFDNKSNEDDGAIKFRSVGNSVNKKMGLNSAFDLSKQLFIDMRKGTGATVISSSGGFEFAIEGDEWNNGLFTYCLLKGLKDEKADIDRDGNIFLSELQAYVIKEVSSLSNNQQIPTSRRANDLMNIRIW